MYLTTLFKLHSFCRDQLHEHMLESVEESDSCLL